MLKKQYLKSKPTCKVTFTLPKVAAENAAEVKVLGDFNDWSWDKGAIMKSSKEEFKTTIELATGKSYAFRYMIDDSGWENDWAADAYEPSPYTGIDNSIVVLEELPVAAPVKKAAKPAAKKTVKKATAPAAKKYTPTMMRSTLSVISGQARISPPNMIDSNPQRPRAQESALTFFRSM